MTKKAALIALLFSVMLQGYLCLCAANGLIGRQSDIAPDYSCFCVTF